MNPERAIGWLFALIVLIILIVVLFRILDEDTTTAAINVVRSVHV